MKVCNKCGEFIATRDGDNTCEKCLNANKKAKAARKKQRQERDDIMRSCGLVKVKGALGGTYWE